MREFPEQDWKTLSKIKDDLLRRFCDSVLDKIKPIVENRGNDSHKEYLRLWKIMHREDKRLSNMFDDLKRSTAFFKLASWKREGLLSDSEFEQFSAETKEIVQMLI